MRLSFLSFVAVASLSISSMAQADPKWSSWGGWDTGFGAMNRANYDFSPYLDDPQFSHPSYNENRDWQPAHWVDQFDGGAEEFIRRGYHAEIIHDQKMKDGVPVLVVGPKFYSLSAYDQRRYVRTVDYIYGTSAHAPFVMVVRDWKSGHVVGALDKDHITFQ
ncbi:MAG: hypothetical protein CL561_03445 [Alphaproteobacteria bacterium]|nr:hypothetical protein [Alphaproteobacteria bacterium]|tara:strand:- start:191 stop:676 length:486 start_codon:yes stop_codon:yes gene_type:complete